MGWTSNLRGLLFKRIRSWGTTLHVADKPERWCPRQQIAAVHPSIWRHCTSAQLRPVRCLEWSWPSLRPASACPAGQRSRGSRQRHRTARRGEDVKGGWAGVGWWVWVGEWVGGKISSGKRFVVCVVTWCDWLVPWVVFVCLHLHAHSCALLSF